MKRYILLIFIVLGYVFASAQVPVGSFRSHIAMHGFFSVAADDNTLYAASANGLMLLDKASTHTDDFDISEWSKVDGLSDIDIVSIYHDDFFNSLIICYLDGNIDLIRNDKLINIRDVMDKSISASKQIQNCRFYEGKAYMVYPFGVVILDLEQLIITDTWFTKRENEQLTATDITKNSQRYYISTTEGVFSIQNSSPMLSDFGQWTEESAMNVSYLAVVSNNVFAIKKASENVENEHDTLMMRTSDGWQSTGLTYQSVRVMNAQSDKLLVCDWDMVELLDSDAKRIFLASWYNGSYPDAHDCVLDQDNIWVADNAYGLVQNNMTYYYSRFFTASGPCRDYVEKVTSKDGVVVAVHGSRRGSTAYAPAYNHPAVSWFQDQEWQFNNTDFLYYDPYHSTFDFTGIAINPKDETEWCLASWTNGIVICKNHQPVAYFNGTNSTLDSTNNGNTAVSSVQYDSKGNLWMTNSFCPTMLKMMEPNGTWHSYDITSVAGVSAIDEIVAENLLIDSRGYKWVNFPRSTGIRDHLIAFTENGTYSNPGDDQLVRVDMNAAAEVNSSTVYCMAEDLDGEIWIGTDKGVKVIYYPAKIFNGGVYPRNILLEQDGYVSVLFEYEEVTAIAVDGANRKWIGTSKAGVFLMNENGQEQLLHFTAEDNPLFSNQIVDINIDQLTGEVFFSTAKGLVSYRGTATAGFETYEDLPVFPNPVPHGYAGVVSINGLKTNSLCKITDSSGKLVWQGYSDGGQLVWDGKDHYGNRPATGVYYVMASDENGKEKIVTKFVFVH